MKKILEVQDIHVCPSWIGDSREHVERICEVAIAEKVDAITVAGDFFHKMFMATDKSFWSEVLGMARAMQRAAQVYYVHGTLSHDAPGCYESFKDIGWLEIGIGKTETIDSEVLIMGMEEVTTAMLAMNFPEMNKAELIEKQYELVNNLIDNFYAPASAAFSGSVHYMGHGHVAGTKFRDDQKPRSSDFMFSEEMLKRTGAYRFQFGHIHLPQEFKTINGCYGGSAHIAWGDLNFKPGFNVTSYEGTVISTERFDYGELERNKFSIKSIEEISEMNKQLKKDCNTWIDIECDKEFADSFDTAAALQETIELYGIGPLSKITCNVKYEEHVRVDLDEYEACNTTEDLYRLYDTEATAKILLKVKEAEQETGTESASIEKHDFDFIDLYLKGTKVGMENGIQEIRMTNEDFRTGANLLTGSNGTGKSFTLGFLTPFSIHLPTGTDFKSLFELKDSQIIRRFKDGDKIITQKILIDPTLANPSAKYYMDIDGDSLTPDGNRKPFDEAVENIFGSIKMFMTCVFRGQKENDNYPSLENAKETDLRKIFTELSGIDRSSMKQFAHDKAMGLKRDIELDEREKETLSGIVEDPKAIESLIDSKNKEIDVQKHDLGKLQEKELVQMDLVKDLQEKSDSNIRTQEAIDEKKDLIKDAEKEISELEASAGKTKKLISDSPSLRTELEALKEDQRIHNELSAEYVQKQADYNKLVEDWFSGKEILDNKMIDVAAEADQNKKDTADYDQQLIEARRSIDFKTKMKSDLNLPCEHCGKLSSDAQENVNTLTSEIDLLKKRIPSINGNIKALTDHLAILRIDYRTLTDQKVDKPVQPAGLEEIKAKVESSQVNEYEIKLKETLVSELGAAEEKLKKTEDQIISHKNDIESFNKLITDNEKSIVPIDPVYFNKTIGSLQEIKHNIFTLNGEIGRFSAEHGSLIKRLEETKHTVNKIETIDSRLTSAVLSKSEWEKIEAAFSPKGIPAMELSLLAPKIDREANRLLNIYGARFKVQTITQALDSKGKNLIEKFKILVHDNLAAEPKNLPVVSGGQGVWITKALQESIAVVASSRTGRNWRYSVMDEADAALDSEIIPVFYRMMDSAMDGSRKLISVSHSSEAKASISSIIDIKEFFVKGDK